VKYNGYRSDKNRVNLYPMYPEPNKYKEVCNLNQRVGWCRTQAVSIVSKKHEI